MNAAVSLESSILVCGVVHTEQKSEKKEGRGGRGRSGEREEHRHYVQVRGVEYTHWRGYGEKGGELRKDVFFLRRSLRSSRPPPFAHAARIREPQTTNPANNMGGFIDGILIVGKERELLRTT